MQITHSLSPSHTHTYTHTYTHTCFSLYCWSDTLPPRLALQGTGQSSCILWWPSWRSVWRRWWRRRKEPWPLCSCRRQPVAYHRVSTSSRGETWSSARRWVAAPRRPADDFKVQTWFICRNCNHRSVRLHTSFKTLYKIPSGKALKCLFSL